MKVKKLTYGYYEVKHNSKLYYISNMIQNCGFWIVKDYNEVHICSMETKRDCLNWIKTLN